MPYSKKTLVTAVVMAAGLAAGAAIIGATASTAASMPSQSIPLAADIEHPVTQEAYDHAYASFADCMRDGGADFIEGATVGNVRQFSYLSDHAYIYDKCYPSFFPYDVAWQLQNEYESPTQVALRECLSVIGVEPGKDAETVWAQVQENKIDPELCTLGIGAQK